MAITALRLLKAAAEQGWWFTVDQGDDDGPVKTKSPAKAWTLVKEVDEADVYFWADGPKGAKPVAVGWAYLMAPSSITCSPEESLTNYSVSAAGVPASPFQLICDRLIEEEM